MEICGYIITNNRHDSAKRTPCYGKPGTLLERQIDCLKSLGTAEITYVGGGHCPKSHKIKEEEYLDLRGELAIVFPSSRIFSYLPFLKTSAVLLQDYQKCKHKASPLAVYHINAQGDYILNELCYLPKREVKHNFVWSEIVYLSGRELDLARQIVKENPRRIPIEIISLVIERGGQFKSIYQPGWKCHRLAGSQQQEILQHYN